MVTPKGSGVKVSTYAKGISFHEIDWKRTFLERLPPPYTTNCYPVSVSKVLDDCLNDEFIDKFKTSCPLRFIAPRRYLGNHLNLSMREDLIKSRDKFSQIFIKCLHKLPNECKTINYDVQLHNSELVDEKKKREVNIIILTPLEQEVIMFASPKLPLSRYLISCGSIFGSWFGFSVFNIASHLLHTAKDFLVKNRSVKHRKLQKTAKQNDSIFSMSINKIHPTITGHETNRYMYF